ncbi:hypothetical protein ITJ64_11715 [Herbiconiux sp. VKM Ac-1786]|uniref:hypothetical protein n=1 Tax=Herbiconiux sp. VKM Ac-1786 TaxID=2783824 RepID=UPI00188DA087|nr:hypothetical protein [Herbiconiux sp. VKM Ac-1786]MBF4573186.1 hypothetical protein [Herbiconiux sp. VKM Ac-1786]
MPELIVVQRRAVLPGGAAFVLSFVEVWPEQTVVRLVGLDGSAGRELRELRMTLTDDTGAEYAWRATSSGGMVLPDEVSVGFHGPLAEAADWIVVSDPGGTMDERIALDRRPI